ncbi:WxL domain-containing protein [Bacillus sp. JCM 19041]|uniref:WxL domain-containing protein n=1 Tax=Bacillus sp. JCM 19041 TaxID=1460637 RepID=UPI0006D2A82B
MKKLSLIPIAVFALILSVGGNTALAEGGTYDTNAKIKFVPAEDGTGPVDPEEPETPVDPVDPTDPEGPGPGTPGPLSIDYASSFQFGEQEITSRDKTYTADPQTYKDTENVGPNYVQVTDNRGTETGWSLQVVQNGQFKTASDQELLGAEIRVKNAAVNSISQSPKPSTVKDSFELTPGTVDNVVSAHDGEGAGTYLYHFGTSATAAESVELFVPGSSTKYADSYSTTLTWTLSDTPGNTEGK